MTDRMSSEQPIECSGMRTDPFMLHLYAAKITGPIAARLWLSSETEDTDLFLVMRVYALFWTDRPFTPILAPRSGKDRNREPMR